MNAIRTETLYNFGYFGSWRQSSQLDGHFEVAIDYIANKFAIVKAYDYGGFQRLGKEKDVFELTPNDYRFLHDALWKDKLKKSDCTFTYSAECLKVKDSLQWYDFQNKYIGANIQYGDEVIDLRTGEIWLVKGFHDLQGVNRDYHYKLTDIERGKLHPPKMKREEFIEKLKSVDVFKHWQIVEISPKKKYDKGWIIVESKKYSFFDDYKDDAQRYIFDESENKLYHRRDTTSGSFWDAISLLTGRVYMKYENDGIPYVYCLTEIKCSTKQYSDKYPPSPLEHYRIFNESESYFYNTRATYL